MNTVWEWVVEEAPPIFVMICLICAGGAIIYYFLEVLVFLFLGGAVIFLAIGGGVCIYRIARFLVNLRR